MAEMGTMGATIMYLGGSTPEGGGPRGQISLDDFVVVNTLPQISRVVPAIGETAVICSFTWGRSYPLAHYI